MVGFSDLEPGKREGKLTRGQDADQICGIPCIRGRCVDGGSLTGIFIAPVQGDDWVFSAHRYVLLQIARINEAHFILIDCPVVDPHIIHHPIEIGIRPIAFANELIPSGQVSGQMPESGSHQLPIPVDFHDTGLIHCRHDVLPLVQSPKILRDKTDIASTSADTPFHLCGSSPVGDK